MYLLDADEVQLIPAQPEVLKHHLVGTLDVNASAGRIWLLILLILLPRHQLQAQEGFRGEGCRVSAMPRRLQGALGSSSSLSCVHGTSCKHRKGSGVKDSGSARCQGACRARPPSPASTAPAAKGGQRAQLSHHTTTRQQDVVLMRWTKAPAGCVQFLSLLAPESWPELLPFAGLP